MAVETTRRNHTSTSNETAVAPASAPITPTTRIYITGALIGLLAGVIAAYLFARSAEDNIAASGSNQNRISTGQIFSLTLAVIALMRQVAEINKPSKKS